MLHFHNNFIGLFGHLVSRTKVTAFIELLKFNFLKSVIFHENIIQSLDVNVFTILGWMNLTIKLIPIFYFFLWACFSINICFSFGRLFRSLLL